MAQSSQRTVLSDIEERMLELLGRLRFAQIKHLAYDPNEPPMPPRWRWLIARRRTLRKWRSSLYRYHSEKGDVEHRPFLELQDLWERIRGPRDLKPVAVEGNDIFFGDSAISFRPPHQRPHGACSVER